MPGITGVIGTEAEAKVLLKRMYSSIKHEDGYLVDEHFSSTFNIARVHLGILNPDPQPIFSEDKGLCIVMDGEIYDYEEEKERLKAKGYKFPVDNDPEFCLYLYEEYGEDFVKELNGSFTLVIWDEKNQKLLIANDRYGSRPLYYALNDGRLLFASEVKAILQDETLKKEINHEAVAEFFTFDYILENKTFFNGINLLPPASIFTYKNGQFSIEQYWDFEFVEEYDKPEDYYIDKLVSGFKKAVERRMVGNHRFGVSLSGGLDSRAVLGAIDKKHFPIYTFTFGVPGCDEAKIAKKVATKVGTIHKFIVLKPEFFASFAEKGVWITDGMCNIYDLLLSISTLEETKKDADIIFHGQGGDNFLRGPWLDDRILKIKSVDILHSEIYKKVNILFNDKHLFSKTYYPEIAGLAFKSLERVLNGTKAKHPGNITDYFIFKNRTRVFKLVLSCTPRIQCEDRAPFFDNNIIDIALTIPPELKLDHRFYIKFLKQLCPDLAKIPYEKTGIRADAPIILNKFTIFFKTLIDSIKRKLSSKTKGLISIPITSGYPDYDEWMRNELKGYIEGILLDERTLNRGYFNREYIHRIIEEHMSRKKDYSRQLSALITFELWQRLFVDYNKKGNMPGIAGVIETETEAKTLLKHISNSIKKIVTGNNPIHAGSMLRKKHFEKLLSVFDFDNNTVVLDAGCGGGYYSRLIAEKWNCRVDALDMQLENIAIQDSRINFIRADLTEYVQPYKYDFIFCIDVLEHILDDEKAIQNIYASLKEGGYAFFHVPLVEPRFTFKWIFEGKHQPDHVRDGHQIDELRNILQRVGFSIIKERKTFGRIGMIGWEIDYILGSLNKYLKFAFIPIMRILSSIDRVYSKNGNCAYFLVGKEKN